MTFRLILAVLALVATTAGAARAETIAYDRAQLASAAGVDALRAAIAEAAERACRREYDGLSRLGPRVRREAVAACVGETIAAAERQAGLGSVRLAARK